MLVDEIRCLVNENLRWMFFIELKHLLFESDLLQ